jgi:hypothetical protein
VTTALACRPADVFCGFHGERRPAAAARDRFLRQCLRELGQRGLMAPDERVLLGPLWIVELNLRVAIDYGYMTLDVEGSPLGRRLAMRITCERRS